MNSLRAIWHFALILSGLKGGLRGLFEEYLYDEKGMLIETIDMRPCSLLANIPAGQWHNLNPFEEQFCMKYKMVRMSR